MYHLYHSPHLTKLAQKLSELLDENKPADPLKPVEIIVPNRDTAQWISLYLAESTGIAANVNYLLPSEWLWQRIRDYDPDLPDLLPSDRGPLTWSIYQLLSDKSIIRQFPVLSRWFEEQTGKKNLHLWQLSDQISSVFDQYQVYRPEMLNEWVFSSAGDGDNWQKSLWNLLVDQWSQLSGNGLRWDRASLFLRLNEKGLSSNYAIGQPVYLFNPGLMPASVSQLLLESGKLKQVYHFMVISTRAVLTDEPGVNRIGRQFGTEQHELYKPVSDFASMNREQVLIQNLYDQKPEDNHLDKLKNSIIHDSELPDFQYDDQSIQVKSCHSPLREVEVLHQFLLGLFSENHDLAPDDILVVTPDLHRYAPFIDAVFGTREEGLPEIPYQISTSPGFTNRVSMAFRDLLEIVDSRFRKEDILEFMHHSAVRDRFQMSDSDFSTINQWFDENRVVWGIDGAHRNEFDQPGTNQQTWKEAMKRGWLGQLVADQPGVITNGILLYAGIVSAEEKELWAKVHSVLTQLIEIRTASKEDKTPDDWLAELESWIYQLFCSDIDYEDESRSVLKICQQLIRELKTGGLETPVSFQIMKKSIKRNLAAKSGGSVSFTRGMMFSSMVPARSLPFKVIALLGLNDDQFPRKPITPEYDLMASERRMGERDRKNEDRNLFLESIMAAGKVHYSSYIGRNQEDDEVLPPSPILDEWIEVLANCHGVNPAQIVQTERLNGYSANLFVKGNEKSFSKSYQHIVRQRYKYSDLKGILIDKSIGYEEEQDRHFIGVDDLTGFYRNPVGSFFNQRLNIYLKNFDEEEDEFGFDGLATHILFQLVFNWKLQGMDNRQITELLLSSGYLPEGWPGEKRVQNAIQIVERTFHQIQQRNFSPKLINHKVRVQLNDAMIEGRVQSYSDSGMLFVYLSGDSGKRMIRSWIQHLLMCTETHDPKFVSTLLFDVKNNSREWKQFPFIANAEELLNELVSTYINGMIEPLNLYINSAYQYAKYADDTNKAANRARFEWEGDFKLFPENSDKYLELILGKNSEVDLDEIARIADLIYRPMIQSVKELE
jgi:exodeoxyribonuclease V gamma subunit